MLMKCYLATINEPKQKMKTFVFLLLAFASLAKAKGNPELCVSGELTVVVYPLVTFDKAKDTCLTLTEKNLTNANVNGRSAIITALRKCIGRNASAWVNTAPHYATPGPCVSYQSNGSYSGSPTGKSTDEFCFVKRSSLCGPVSQYAPTPVKSKPTFAPVSAPTPVPTKEPTVAPVTAPTSVPTKEPTVAPVTAPTPVPTAKPTLVPTAQPTPLPTLVPISVPTSIPTQAPTHVPTAKPTQIPTKEPTAAPAPAPTPVPTAKPTLVPTAQPTPLPTLVPISVPTSIPTFVPTLVPTRVPTHVPTPAPTTPTPTTPPDVPICFSGSNLTTGDPFDQATCPPNACISTIAVALTDYNNEPTFSGLTATCIDFTDNNTTTINLGYGDTTTSVNVKSNKCFKGISGFVDIEPSDYGLYVSTLITDEQPPQLIGYINNTAPYNVPIRPLGYVHCGKDSYLNAVFGRSGIILDALCFVCSEALPQTVTPSPILTPTPAPAPETPAPTPEQDTPSPTPEPEDPNELKIEVGPGVSYTAHSLQLSDAQVSTNVTDNNGVLVLIMNFMTNNTMLTAVLPSLGKQLAWNIPELLGVDIDSSTIYTFNTVAAYVAAQTTFATIYPNSTAGRRKLLNGVSIGDILENHPGCDFFIDTACTIGCCATHDECFQNNGCNLASWITPDSKCYKTCNTDVVRCMLDRVPQCHMMCNGQDLPPPLGTPKKSCYDHHCSMFYDCPDGCPSCPIAEVDSSPPNGCCNCQSPCFKCKYICQDGTVVNFHNEDECIDFCTNAGKFGATCCLGLSGFAYTFCTVFGQAGCALTCGDECPTS